MKKCCYMILLFIFILLSCNRNDNKTASVNSDRKDVIDLVTVYAMGKFNAPKQTEATDGIITIEDKQVNLVVRNNNQSKCIIDPSKIFTGLIDDDENEDAIITLYFLSGQSNPLQEILILMNTDGRYKLNRVIESEMKIMGIKNREIIVEISTRSPDSPLRDCSACKEIVKYKFSLGDLIRIE